MPHKWYQGKTGVVWNVTKRALGVEINKAVGNRVIKKRIHVRVEHVQPSQCRGEFLRRRVENDKKRAAAKEKGGESRTLILIPLGILSPAQEAVLK